MKKVLLAVIGAIPNQKAYRYALQLSRQIQAELDVLQLEKPHGRKGNENRFMSPRKRGVRFQRTTCKGDPTVEIANYINQNRDVVFTIYDASSGVWRKRKKIPKEMKRLPVPIVVVRS